MRLRTRQEYRRMAHGAQRYVGRWIMIDVRSGIPDLCRLGIVVTRRYGKAHDRNRFKRLVREAFRISYEFLPKGIDILCRPRTQAYLAKMQDIQTELIDLLRSTQECV